MAEQSLLYNSCIFFYCVHYCLARNQKGWNPIFWFNTATFFYL